MDELAALHRSPGGQAQLIRLIMLDLRLLRLVHGGQRLAPAPVGVAIIRIELRRLLVFLRRLNEFFLVEERVAPVFVGVGIVRIEPRRPLVLVDRVFRPLQVAQRRAPIVIGPEKFGSSRVARSYLSIVSSLSISNSALPQFHQTTALFDQLLAFSYLTIASPALQGGQCDAPVVVARHCSDRAASPARIRRSLRRNSPLDIVYTRVVTAPRDGRSGHACRPGCFWLLCLVP